MPKEFFVQRLDVQAFAEEAGRIEGRSRLGAHERLMAETQGRGAEGEIAWLARGELRNPRHVNPEVWLHLKASAVLSLTCQRCMGPVDVPVQVERSFRFVKDEATAEAQDDASDEDLLALSRSFDLLALVEDELLMDMPLVPRHDVCPEAPALSVEDPDFEQAGERPNPFAVLGRLKGGKDS